MGKIGNSIISLGSFGGTRKYKYMGYKDSFGLHRKNRRGKKQSIPKKEERDHSLYKEELLRKEQHVKVVHGPHDEIADKHWRKHTRSLKSYHQQMIKEKVKSNNKHQHKSVSSRAKRPKIKDEVRITKRDNLPSNGVKTYYYNEKNTVVKGDRFCFKRSYNCGHRMFIIINIKDGNVYAKCTKCKRVYLFSYIKFLLMHYYAKKDESQDTND